MSDSLEPELKKFLKGLRRWYGITLDLPYRFAHEGKRAKRFKDAQVFSSILEGSERFFEKPRHALILDIDYPVYVVPSSTKGHSHVYFDVPGGIDDEIWRNVMGTLGKAGVIEKGYADSCLSLGEAILRAPWVKKTPRSPLPPRVRTLKELPF